MYSVDEIYQNHILNTLVRRPKSKIIVDGMEYTGESHLKTFPKIEHSTEDMFGAFPAKTCEFEIYNLDGSVNLNGKEVSVYRGLVIGGMPQWVPMGIFKAESKDITTNLTTKTIKFKGSDRSRLFDVAFNSALHTYPCTVLDFVKQLCTNHSVTLANEDFPFASLELTTAPEFAEGVTERELIRKIAQLGGCIAQITRNGELKISQPEAASIPITSGKYSSLSKERPVYITTVTISQSGAEDVTVSDSTYVGAYGEYVYKIADNPFIKDRQNEVIDEIKSKIINRSVTPFVLNGFIDDFIYDLNDMVTIRDKSGTEFTTPILSLTTQSRIKSDFKTEVQKESASSGSLGGSLKQQVEISIKDNNNFKKAQTGLNELMANAMGLHTSTVDDGAGGKLYYFHDTENIANATYIATFTSNGFAYTKGSGCWNGGNPKWQYGIDADGNAVLNTLALHGLIADWIKAGTLQSLNGSTFFNLDKGEIGSETTEETVYIFGSKTSLGFDSTEKTLKKTSKLTFEAGSLVQSVTLESAEGELIDSYTLSLGLFANVQKGMIFEHSSTYFNKTGKFYFLKPDDWDSKSEIAKAALLISYYAAAKTMSDGVTLINSETGATANLSTEGLTLMDRTEHDDAPYFITQANKNGFLLYHADAEGNAAEQEAGFFVFDSDDGKRVYANLSDAYAFRSGATVLPVFTKDYTGIFDNSPGILNLDSLLGTTLEQTGATHIRARVTLLHYNGNSEYIILWNTSTGQIFVDCVHITGGASTSANVMTPVLQGETYEGTLAKALTPGERTVFYESSINIVPKSGSVTADSYITAVIEVLTYR